MRGVRQPYGWLRPLQFSLAGNCPRPAGHAGSGVSSRNQDANKKNFFATPPADELEATQWSVLAFGTLVGSLCRPCEIAFLIRGIPLFPRARE